jgi:hypothetical protein
MLALAKQKFISDLTSNYSDVSEKKTWSVFANRECDAIHSFIIKAIPMTLISTFSGGVSGYATQGPVQGKAIGGLDKRSPSIGLQAAKKILEQDLLNAYSHHDLNNPSRIQAIKIANAIEKYMLSAVVRTKEITKGPRPAPATSGPVQGPIEGLGGVLTDRPGIGYQAAKPRFKKDMEGIYSKIDKNFPHSQKAREIADAIHKFAVEGIIKTKGTFVAGAAVSPKSGNGGYFPGQGQSITGTLS